jgi:hypothetical protein
VPEPRASTDVNAVIGGYLRDPRRHPRTAGPHLRWSDYWAGCRIPPPSPVIERATPASRRPTAVASGRCTTEATVSGAERAARYLCRGRRWGHDRGSGGVCLCVRGHRHNAPGSRGCRQGEHRGELGAAATGARPATHDTGRALRFPSQPPDLGIGRSSGRSIDRIAAASPYPLRSTDPRCGLLHDQRARSRTAAPRV